MDLRSASAGKHRPGDRSHGRDVPRRHSQGNRSADRSRTRVNPAPDLAEMKRRAEALLPRLRERAAETETVRRIPDATLADLHAAGLFRMLQPKRVGGSEASYRALVDIGAIV